MRKSITFIALLLAALFAFSACGTPEPAEGEAARMFYTMHIEVPETPFLERNLRQDGTITVLDPDGEIVFEDVDAMVRGRGNSTWWHGPEKRPLRFRFAEAQSMFGSDYEARDWILLANHFDQSLLRNYTALHFASLLRFDFVPRPIHVHLYVNGEYMGVYTFTDERDVNPGRMELEWNPDPSLSSYFLEMDGRAPNDGVENETFVFVNHIAYDLRWPDFPDELTPEHVEYIKAYLYAVSDAIRSENFEDIIQLIDLDTFVDFYIVQEFVKDPDAHITSVFMHIDGVGDERRLFMGPVWDYDLSIGNRGGQILGHGPEDLYVAVLHYWYRHLLQTPEFFDAVAARWNEIEGTILRETIDHVRDIATTYEAAFNRNFERHAQAGSAVQFVPPEILEIYDFIDHVEHMLGWLEARAQWMSDFFNGRLPDYDPMWALVEYYTNVSPILIIKDGEYQEFEIAPIIMNDRTQMALPEIARLIDATLSEDPATGLITITKGANTITHQPGETVMYVNGVRSELPMTSHMIIRGDAWLPLYRVVRSMGYEIDWHETLERTLVMTSP